MPANYHATLKAKDSASTVWTDLSNFDITVYNQPPIENPNADPADIEVTVWSDFMPILQSRSKCPDIVTIDLSQYWIDPDGLQLRFNILEVGISDNDKNPPPFAAEQKDGQLTISAIEKRKTTSSGFVIYEVKPMLSSAL